MYLICLKYIFDTWPLYNVIRLRTLLWSPGPQRWQHRIVRLFRKSNTWKQLTFPLRESLNFQESLTQDESLIEYSRNNPYFPGHWKKRVNFISFCLKSILMLNRWEFIKTYVWIYALHGCVLHWFSFLHYSRKIEPQLKKMN